MKKGSKDGIIGKKTKWLVAIFCVLLVSLVLQSIPNNSGMESSAMGREEVATEQGHVSEPNETPDQKGKVNESNSTDPVNNNDSIKPQAEQLEQPAPIEQPEVNQANEVDKVAYITFDDGPSNTTERLLDILSEHSVKATFFMLQPRVCKFPDSVIRIVNDGHTPALHGVSHSQQAFYQSTESVLNEMNTAQAAVLEITGYKTTLIRTPFGSHPYMKPTYKEAVKQAGYQLWDWNVDSRDWYYRDHRMVTNTIEQIKRLEERNIAPVILLHDRTETVEFVAEILEHLTSNGYQLKQLDATMEPVVFGE